MATDRLCDCMGHEDHAGRDHVEQLALSLRHQPEPRPGRVGTTGRGGSGTGMEVEPILSRVGGSFTNVLDPAEDEVGGRGPLERLRVPGGPDGRHFDTYCRGLVPDLPRQDGRADRLAPPGPPPAPFRNSWSPPGWDPWLTRPPSSPAGRGCGRVAGLATFWDGRGDRRDELPQEGGQDPAHHFVRRRMVGRGKWWGGS